MPAPVAPLPAAPPPAVVLDTNVLLDWTVFADPSCRSLDAAVRAGRVRWVASPPMRAEFDHVVARDGLARWQPDMPVLAAHWDRWASMAAPPPANAVGPHGLHCTDPDDQMFIELALAQRCRWLLSRDRAVLKLARRAAAHGVTITTPASWTDPFVAGP